MKILNNLVIKVFITLIAVTPLSYGHAAQGLQDESQQNQSEPQPDSQVKTNEQYSQETHPAATQSRIYPGVYDPTHDTNSYNPQGYQSDVGYVSDCCECPSVRRGSSRGWLIPALAVGAAAAIGGVIGGEINHQRGRHGEEGPQGDKGKHGLPGSPLFGRDKGESLTFIFSINELNPCSVKTLTFASFPSVFVATPDGHVESLQFSPTISHSRTPLFITINDPSFGAYKCGVHLPLANDTYSVFTSPILVTATRNRGSTTQLPTFCTESECISNACIGPEPTQVETLFTYGPFDTGVPSSP